LIEERAQVTSRRMEIDMNEASGVFQIIPDALNNMQVFELFDHDQSGTIEEKEFEVALHSLGYKLTPAGALKYFKECDKDGSDAIDLEELIKIIKKKHGGNGGGDGGDSSAPGSFGVDTQKCVEAVNQIRAAYMESHTEETGLPKHLMDWCTSLSSSSSSQNPEGRHAALAWKAGCAQGRARLEGALKTGGFDPKLFCEGMSETLGKHVAAAAKYDKKIWVFDTNYTRTTPYAPPLATASCDLSYLKEPRPCCKAHGLKGCHDKPIEQCVCAADPHCCEKEWDMRCSELVEKIRIRDDHFILRCGRCPVPKDDIAALANCLESGCG